MLIKGNLYPIKDIISYMKNNSERDDNFCLYGDLDEDLQSNKSYYIDNYPDVDENGKEIYPFLVLKKKLYYLYSGEQFADVIDSVLDQKPSATINDFIKALNYYSEYDDFLDI
jgi:uncharacterized protein (DUF433 family)